MYVFSYINELPHHLESYVVPYMSQQDGFLMDL